MDIITLKNLAEEYNKLGITWWLMYGSLLCAVRDGKRDKYDIDIDIGIYGEDTSKLKDFGNGIVARYNNHPVYWNYGKNPIINVQAWWPFGDKRYYFQDNWIQQELPYNMQFVQFEFEKIMCNIPSVYLKLLEDWFSNWKVPMKEKARTRIYKLTRKGVEQVKFENPWPN